MKTQRLLSLDALRGFDMFWIIGADEVLHSMAKATGSPAWQKISAQFEHPYWEGFTLYDLIFPLFIFVTGISANYSLGAALEKGVASIKPRPEGPHPRIDPVTARHCLQ